MFSTKLFLAEFYLDNCLGYATAELIVGGFQGLGGILDLKVEADVDILDC